MEKTRRRPFHQTNSSIKTSLVPESFHQSFHDHFRCRMGESLTAKYQDRFSVFMGALLALWSVTLLALVGIYFLFEALTH